MEKARIDLKNRSSARNKAASAKNPTVPTERVVDSIIDIIVPEYKVWKSIKSLFVIKINL